MSTSREGGPAVEYVGIDWSCRRAAWCALSERGTIVGEGAVPADEDGLARLVIERLLAARPVVLVMSGAISVRDTLAAAGWQTPGRPCPQGARCGVAGLQDRRGRRQGPGRALSPRPRARAARGRGARRA